LKFTKVFDAARQERTIASSEWILAFVSFLIAIRFDVYIGVKQKLLGLVETKLARHEIKVRFAFNYELVSEWAYRFSSAYVYAQVINLKIFNRQNGCV
jgi:hypothetical protein